MFLTKMQESDQSPKISGVVPYTPPLTNSYFLYLPPASLALLLTIF
jgi:hypothetical protein